jgi:glycerol uptake facilitator-like aquaporin
MTHLPVRDCTPLFAALPSTSARPDASRTMSHHLRVLFDAGLAAVFISTHARSRPNLWLHEIGATIGLLLVVVRRIRSGRRAAAPFAVTLSRTLSDTFAGIAAASVVPFILAQLVGAAIACVVVRVLWPRIEEDAQELIVPHQTEVPV